MRPRIHAARLRIRPIWLMAAATCLIPTLLISDASLQTADARMMMGERPTMGHASRMDGGRRGGGHRSGGHRSYGFRGGSAVGMGLAIGGMVVDQIQRQQARDNDEPRDAPARRHVDKPSSKSNTATSLSKPKKKDPPSVARKKEDEPVYSKSKSDMLYSKKQDTPYSGRKKDEPRSGGSDPRDVPVAYGNPKDEPVPTGTTTRNPGLKAPPEYPTGRPPLTPSLVPPSTPFLVSNPVPQFSLTPPAHACRDCKHLWDDIQRLKKKIAEDEKRLADSRKMLEERRRQKDQLETKLRQAKNPIWKDYYRQVIKNADEFIEAIEALDTKLDETIAADKEQLNVLKEAYNRCADKECRKNEPEAPPVSSAPPPEEPKDTPVAAGPPPQDPPAAPPKTPPSTPANLPEPEPTPPPPTPSSTTPQHEVKICGPDITEHVLDVLRRLKRRFEARPDLQVEACRNLISPSTGGTAWDITALSPGSAPLPDSSYDPATDSYVPPPESPYKFKKKPWFTKVTNRCAIPRPTCGATVEFMGTCQHAQVVNYTQWGMMMALCGGAYPVIGAGLHGARNFSKFGFGSSPSNVQDNMAAVGKEYKETLDRENQQNFRYAKHNKDDLDAIKRRLQERDQATDHPEKNCELACKLTAGEQEKLKKEFLWNSYWEGLN